MLLGMDFCKSNYIKFDCEDMSILFKTLNYPLYSNAIENKIHQNILELNCVENDNKMDVD